MAEKQKWRQPEGNLRFSPPDDFVPESEKTSDWYCNYARWIVSTFYNQSRGAFYLEDVQTLGIAEEAVRNWSYYFARQANYNYNHVTTSMDNKSLPSVWIPGGKVAQLVDHLRGTLLTTIESIEVTATNLSKDVLSKRSDMLEKLSLQYDLKDILKQFPQAVKFSPVSDPAAQNLESPEEIDKYVTTWQDEYSIISEKIGEAMLYMDNLEDKFLQVGTNQYIAGLSGMLTEVMNGKVTNVPVDAHEIIWDNRVNDPYNRSAMLCGVVKHNAPYQEVINRFKDELTKDEIEDIRQMAVSEYSNLDEFLTYYNRGFGIGNNFTWWNQVGTSTMTLGYATVYFIAPTNFKYKKLKNRYGKDRIVKIQPDKKYQVGDERIEGAKINGDWSGWDIYQATLIGNKYICGYGLMSNALRDTNDKGKPLLPMRIYCANMALNQGMSLVSRLKPHQDEIDRLSYAIEQKIANDYGKNYIINGNKLGQVQSTEFVNDLKTIHVHVATGVSGESDDPTNQQRMVESLDMTLDSNIIRYVELKNEQKQEMDQIASTSQIALGQQPNVVGKGVQQRTITQNSYGTLSLQTGLMNHFNQIVQYNVNLKQMLYQYSDTVEESLIIGDKGSYFLKIVDPKEYGTQPIQVYINISSSYSEQDRADIKAIAMANAQNGGMDIIDFIEHILLSRTPNQAVKGMKMALNKKIKEQSENAKAQQQAEQAGAQQAIQLKASLEAAQQELKENNENWRTQFKVLNENMIELKRLMQNQPPTSPLLTQMGQQQQVAQAQPQEPIPQ